MNIYLAGPLFSKAERNWMREIRHHILEFAKKQPRDVQIVWPYELISQHEIESMGAKAIHEIFSRNKSKLDTANILIAVLDGTQVDDGTAWEIGYFYARKSVDSKIIGIRTDFRNAGDLKHSTINLMIEASCNKIVTSIDDMLAELI
jgi:nucleoside 2-deoxyribosyltransferase